MTLRECGTRLLIPVAMLLWLSGCSSLVRGGAEREDVIDVGQPDSVLTCDRDEEAADTDTIGPEGGQLMSGRNVLTIPDSAIMEERPLTFRQLPGNSVGVEVDEEVEFDNNKSATLVIDIQGCVNSLPRNGEWFVWRINTTDRSQSQKLRTRFEGDAALRNGGARAVTLIDSTSVYMIAN